MKIGVPMMARRISIGTTIHVPIWKCLLLLAVTASRVAVATSIWCGIVVFSFGGWLYGGSVWGSTVR
jgi:hypothetical protein